VTLAANPSRPAEQSRARYPDREGVVDRRGVRVHWEEYGSGDPAVLFVPPWSIVHSRCWKLQIPDFARRHRVLTFDPRGNGRSDRPNDPAAYREDEFALDAVAVLDAAGVADAAVITLSLGAQRSLIVAAEHPQRVCGLVLIAPLIDLGLPAGEERSAADSFSEDSGEDEGWARYNAHSWRRDYQGFVEFFFGQVFCEPHSTKQIEDCVGWGLETDAETLITAEVPGLDRQRTRQLCDRVQCPVLVLHGDQDAIVPHAWGAEVARVTGGRLLTMEGSGHCPQARDPVGVNLILRDFMASLPDVHERRGNDGHRG
jgi:pimeloyl-ACP methyl ester carboxylesterase